MDESPPPPNVDEAFRAAYDELQRLARYQLARTPERMVSTTSLVHETYFRLRDRQGSPLVSREHFFATAATAMRHLLIDLARRRRADKRGGGEKPLSLDETRIAIEEKAEQLLVLEDALGALEKIEPRLAKLVELRFFGGLSVEETAEVLGISTRTVKRDWRKARAVLSVALGGGGDAEAPPAEE
ncbi:MAG: ECF-type sigma factor [Acidobacteriota bacterium]